MCTKKQNFILLFNEVLQITNEIFYISLADAIFKDLQSLKAPNIYILHRPGNQKKIKKHCIICIHLKWAVVFTYEVVEILQQGIKPWKIQSSYVNNAVLFAVVKVMGSLHDQTSCLSVRLQTHYGNTVFRGVLNPGHICASCIKAQKKNICVCNQEIHGRVPSM